MRKPRGETPSPSHDLLTVSRDEADPLPKAFTFHPPVAAKRAGPLEPSKPLPPVSRMPALKAEGGGLPVATGPDHAKPRLPEQPAPSPTPSRETIPKSITNSIGMKLVRIEPGEFLMGSPDSDRYSSEFGDYSDAPQHRVRIKKAFYLAAHEVTEGQYEATMGSNPSHFKGPNDLPVEDVTWLGAVNFCNKLSEKDKRKQFYRISGTDVADVGGNGYRLPLEAEWEYACRAGSTARYPFGDQLTSLPRYAWYHDNSGDTTHEVGARLSNNWGLYDMLGNVWEWCEDKYDPKDTKYDFRVCRGGGWRHTARYCRSASRGLQSGYDVGFRVAVNQE